MRFVAHCARLTVQRGNRGSRFCWRTEVLVAPLFQLGPYREEFALFSVLVLLYFQSRVLEFALASHMLHRYAVGATVLLAVGKLLAYVLLAGGSDIAHATQRDPRRYARVRSLLPLPALCLPAPRGG